MVLVLVKKLLPSEELFDLDLSPQDSVDPQNLAGFLWVVFQGHEPEPIALLGPPIAHRFHADDLAELAEVSLEPFFG